MIVTMTHLCCFLAFMTNGNHFAFHLPPLTHYMLMAFFCQSLPCICRVFCVSVDMSSVVAGLRKNKNRRCVSHVKTTNYEGLKGKITAMLFNITTIILYRS